MSKYTFTKHAKDQFKDRFPDKIIDDNVVMSIVYELNNAKVDNTIKNNTLFMTRMYEEHGYDAVDFLTTEDAVFVCRGSSLVTVYPNDDNKFMSRTGRFTGKFFKRKPKVKKPWMK